MRQSEKLALQATEAYNSGKVAEAVTLFQNVLRLDPKDRRALNFLSHYALQSGQFDAAIQFLADLIKAEPANSNARRMLGEALEMKNLPEQAEKLYRDALVADPANHMAAVYLAILLARRGKQDKAAQIVSLAFQQDPTFIEYGYAPEVFPAAAQRVRDADVLLRAHLNAQHKDAAKASERIASAIWPQIPLERFEYTTPGQQPWLFYLPDLPAAAVHDAATVPGLADFAASAEAIRAEATANIDLEADGEPGAPGLPAVMANSSVRSVFLYRNGERQEALDALPALEAALGKLNLGKAGNGPADVRLVILAPGAERQLVFGQSNAHLTIHLPLVAGAGEAGVEVDGSVRNWTIGEPLVFDDTFEHKLVNRTDAPVMVLHTQVYHPELGAADIAAIEASFNARRDWLANRSFD
ncbi:MAG TPA: aspartyl/asparaginyl beta-hydroxylase domain-containing protein [Pedomonas sp.]|uniref:tetratricopeptide repeat protein n=1 Tax=Pedomonas sp. TaxID=2976421 RepID=UPI002F426043